MTTMRFNLEDMTPREQAMFLQEVATMSQWLSELAPEVGHATYEIFQPNAELSTPGNMPKVRLELMSHQLHSIYTLREQDRKLAAMCRNTQIPWPDGVQEALEFWNRIRFRLGQLDMDPEGLIDHLDTMVEANGEAEQPEGGKRIDSL